MSDNKSDDKIVVLMEHTIHHNKHHAEDFADIAAKLRDKGAGDAAALVDEAAKDIESAVNKLTEAKELYLG